MCTVDHLNLDYCVILYRLYSVVLVLLSYRHLQPYSPLRVLPNVIQFPVAYDDVTVSKFSLPATVYFFLL